MDVNAGSHKNFSFAEIRLVTYMGMFAPSLLIKCTNSYSVWQYIMFLSHSCLAHISKWLNAIPWSVCPILQLIWHLLASFIIDWCMLKQELCGAHILDAHDYWCTCTYTCICLHLWTWQSFVYSIYAIAVLGVVIGVANQKAWFLALVALV